MIGHAQEQSDMQLVIIFINTLITLELTFSTRQENEISDSIVTSQYLISRFLTEAMCDRDL